MELFDIEAACKQWNGLSSKYSHRYQKTFSAWERLSYYLRHHYSRHYDGGALRVIAFFGEAFPEHITDTEVFFSAGPMSAGIGADPHSDRPSERYLLLNMAKAFSKDDHLNYYIKGYTNAWHDEKGRRSRNKPMFDTLHSLLVREIGTAHQKGDRREESKLRELAEMIRVISHADFA